jgi:16S rRNA (uracil1498-N3)-methyltransferase
VRDARTRLIVPELPRPGETVSLPAAEAAHARARRLAAGDSVLLIDGSGRSAAAEVVRATRAATVVRVSAVLDSPAASPAISLYVAGLRAERLAWLVEKATELGAARVVLLESARTQSFRAAPSLLPRLERVARAAAKQCGRTDWPAVAGPTPLERALADESSPTRWFLDFDGEPFPESAPVAASALAVGPEGGWTDAERVSASARGWKRVTLAVGTLRAETAAIAGLVLLRAAMDRKTG